MASTHLMSAPSTVKTPSKVDVIAVELLGAMARASAATAREVSRELLETYGRCPPPRPRGVRFIHDNQRWVIDPSNGRIYSWRIASREWSQVTGVGGSKYRMILDAGNAAIKARKAAR